MILSRIKYFRFTAAELAQHFGVLFVGHLAAAKLGRIDAGHCLTQKLLRLVRRLTNLNGFGHEFIGRLRRGLRVATEHGDRKSHV